MEFDFSLYPIVGRNSIYVVDKNLRPFEDLRDSTNRKNLSDVIDKIGTASAKAQHLPGPITTSNKLTFTDQRVYIYCEHDTNSNKECVVGFLKVGTKKLFLYDANGNQKEVSPLCVLDFYVHESKQRKGHGKVLFEYMLQQESVQANQLAVDRPSEKFVSFLCKHYKLRATIPQVNNYMIFEGFFSHRHDKPQAVRNRKSDAEPPGNPMAADRSKSSTQKPSASSHGTSISQPNQMKTTAGPQSNQNNHSSALGSQSTSSASSVSDELSALSNIPLSRPSSREKLVNLSNQQQTPSTTSKAEANSKLPDGVTQLMINSSSSRSQSAQNNAYSRHVNPALPHQYATSNQSDYSEPIRSRSGKIHTEYNTHQSAFNKQGHLKVTADVYHNKPADSPGKKLNGVQDPQEWSKTFHSPTKAKQADSSFNIFGVPTGYRHVTNRKIV